MSDEQRASGEATRVTSQDGLANDTIAALRDAALSVKRFGDDLVDARERVDKLENEIDDARIKLDSAHQQLAEARDTEALLGKLTDAIFDLDRGLIDTAELSKMAHDLTGDR